MTTNMFSLFTLQELFDAKNGEHEMVVEGMLPRGALSILGAKPKVGKSTLKRNIEYAVATGTPVIGRETVQGRVLSLTLEESAADVANEYKLMGATGDEDMKIHVGIAPQDHLLALEAAIRDCHPLALVTIDPLQRFMRIRDLNDYTQVTGAFEPLAELARLYKVHIMLVHHIGKAEPSGMGSASDRFIGSTAIFGSVDMGLIMLKKGEERTLQTDGPQRFGINIPETVLHFDPDTHLLTAGPALSVAKRDELRQRIIDVVTDMWTPMTEIKKSVGGDTAKVHSEVLSLHQDGFLDRKGSGDKGDAYMYRVVQPPESAKPNGHDRRAQLNGLAQEYIRERDSSPLWQS